MAEKGINLCRKVSKPTEEHRAVLSQLFSSGSGLGSSEVAKSSSEVAKSFDPSEFVSLKAVKPKKTRAKPYKRWVIVMDRPASNVPSAGIRRKLKKQGREKKVEFKRSYSKTQVKDAIRDHFPQLRLDSPTFWKCRGSNIMELVEIEGYPDGKELFDIASKESLYIVEDEVVR